MCFFSAKSNQRSRDPWSCYGIERWRVSCTPTMPIPISGSGRSVVQEGVLLRCGAFAIHLTGWDFRGPDATQFSGVFCAYSSCMLSRVTFMRLDYYWPNFNQKAMRKVINIMMHNRSTPAISTGIKIHPTLIKTQESHLEIHKLHLPNRISDLSRATPQRYPLGNPFATAFMVDAFLECDFTLLLGNRGFHVQTLTISEALPPLQVNFWARQTIEVPFVVFALA